MTATRQVTINPRAALSVEMKDNQHQRNDRLLLENENLELRAKVDEQAAEIERLTKLLPPEAEPTAKPKKEAN